MLSPLLFKDVLKVPDNVVRQESTIKFYIFDVKVDTKLMYNS